MLKIALISVIMNACHLIIFTVKQDQCLMKMKLSFLEINPNLFERQAVSDLIFFSHFSPFLAFSCCIQAHLVASGQPQLVPQGRAPPSASVPPTAQQVSSDMKMLSLICIFVSHVEFKKIWYMKGF